MKDNGLKVCVKESPLYTRLHDWRYDIRVMWVGNKLER